MFAVVRNTGEVVQSVTSLSNINMAGMYAIEVPFGVVTGTTPSTIASNRFDSLKQAYGLPYLYGNSLLDSSGASKIDASALFQGKPVRGVVSDKPFRTTVSAANPLSTHGLIVTDTIDISLTNPTGSSLFRVWWSLATISRSTTVSVDTSPSPSGFTVFLSNDDGGSWASVGHGQVVDCCAKGSNIRLAFVNSSAIERNLTAYAVLPIA